MTRSDVEPSGAAGAQRSAGTAEDPAVTSGTAQMEIGEMLAGFVRPG